MEKRAEDFVKCGEIDQAIEIYQSLTPHQPRILNIIGTLYAEKKCDYELSIYYFQQALTMQEEVWTPSLFIVQNKDNVFFSLEP